MYNLVQVRVYYHILLQLKSNNNLKHIVKIYYFKDNHVEINLINFLEIILIFKDIKEMYLILILNNYLPPWLLLPYKNVD